MDVEFSTEEVVSKDVGYTMKYLGNENDQWTLNDPDNATFVNRC